jgi:hypothetical protein
MCGQYRSFHGIVVLLDRYILNVLLKEKSMTTALTDMTLSSALAQIAKVKQVENGLAKTVLHYGKTLQVYAQAAHVGPLQAGDEILFLESNKGPYIVAQTFIAGPPFIGQQPQTQIRTTPEGDIYLTTGKASLRLTADGKIELQGVQMSQHAADKIEITAENYIALNCRDGF